MKICICTTTKVGCLTELGRILTIYAFGTKVFLPISKGLIVVPI